MIDPGGALKGEDGESIVVFEQAGDPGGAAELGDFWIDTDEVPPTFAVSGVPVVTSIPTAPVDGQEVYYRFAQTVVPVEAQTLLWHLRFDAALSKWLPVGRQEPIMAWDNAQRSQAFGAGWSQFTQQLAATAPVGGRYRIRWGANGVLSSSAVVNIWVGLIVNGAWTNDYGSAGSGSTATWSMAAASSRFTVGPADLSVYWGMFPSAGTTCNAWGRYIEMHPVEIG